jgi:hypothetical protein
MKIVENTSWFLKETGEIVSQSYNELNAMNY